MRLRLWPVAVLLLAAGGGCDQLTELNASPEADAGEDATVYVGETVTLDASNSMDEDGDALTFAWTLTTQPDTSDAELAVTDAADVDFVPDVPGTYVFTVQVSDGDESDSDEVVVTAEWDLRLSGTISADSTLEDRGAPYTVANALTLGATLTIQPGVRIEFAEGARLIVASGGALVAIGTAADSIHFTGAAATAGSWQGIEIASASPSNELTYVEIAHGGEGNWSNVYVHSGAAVKITHSLIRDSETVGVDNNGSLAGWSQNTLRDNAVAGLELTSDAIRYLDAASVYADGSTPYALRVTGGTASAAGTWPKTDRPYLMAGTPTAAAAIVLQPGVVLEFEQGERFIVASGGSLNAVGTAEDTIRLIGTEAQAGFWQGIEVSSASTSNELTYVEVAYGGEGNWANVYVHSGALIEVTNSLLRNSATVAVDNNGALTGWSANTLRDNVVAGIELVSDAIRYLDAGTTYAGGSTPYALRVTGGTASVAGTWPSMDGAYLMAGTPTLAAAVTVQPGATLLFEQAERLIIASGGSLTAQGTTTDTITIAGVEEIAGFWQGIEVASLDNDNSLDYVNLGFGGAGSWANIYIHSGASMAVANSIIHDSDGCGVEVVGDGTYTATNVSYSNNANGDVCAP